MSDQSLAVHIAADADQLEGLAGHLQATLGDVGDAEVEPEPETQLPAGAKGVGVLGLGGLLVRAARSSKVLDKLVNAVQAWLGQQEGRTVRLEADGDAIELTGLSAADQEELVREWVARHAPSG